MGTCQVDLLLSAGSLATHKITAPGLHIASFFFFLVINPKGFLPNFNPEPS